MDWPHPLTILLVDDNTDVRDGFSVALKQGGYSVETASDGSEALSKLRGGLHPAVIVLDLIMPSMNGYEFREAQLQAPDLSGIPLIVYSAHTSVRENAGHLGANIYLDRPVHPAALVAAVQALCPTSTGTQ